MFFSKIPSNTTSISFQSGELKLVLMKKENIKSYDTLTHKLVILKNEKPIPDLSLQMNETNPLYKQLTETFKSNEVDVTAIMSILGKGGFSEQGLGPIQIYNFLAEVANLQKLPIPNEALDLQKILLEGTYEEIDTPTLKLI